MILVGSHITWFLCGPLYEWRDPRGQTWLDRGARDGHEGPYALQGTPIGTEGFAISNHSTLGGYFRLTIPHYKIDTIERQIDIGPKKPVIDLSAALAFKLFGSQSNFPDYSDWKLEYIGLTLPVTPA